MGYLRQYIQQKNGRGMVNKITHIMSIELTVKRLLSIIATDKDILMVKRVVGMRVRKR